MDLDSYRKEILNTWLLRDYFYLDASTYCLQELNSNYGHTFWIVYICISKRNVNILFHWDTWSYGFCGIMYSEIEIEKSGGTWPSMDTLYKLEFYCGIKYCFESTGFSFLLKNLRTLDNQWCCVKSNWSFTVKFIPQSNTFISDKSFPNNIRSIPNVLHALYRHPQFAK